MAFSMFLHDPKYVCGMHSLPSIILLSYQLDIRTCCFTCHNRDWSRNFHWPRLHQWCCPACEIMSALPPKVSKILSPLWGWMSHRMNLGAEPPELPVVEYCGECWWVHLPRLQAECKWLQQTGYSLMKMSHCLPAWSPRLTYGSKNVCAETQGMSLLNTI